LQEMAGGCRPPVSDRLPGQFGMVGLMIALAAEVGCLSAVDNYPAVVCDVVR
jgi:hypothetical protein